MSGPSGLKYVAVLPRGTSITMMMSLFNEPYSEQETICH